MKLFLRFAFLFLVFVPPAYAAPVLLSNFGSDHNNTIKFKSITGLTLQGDTLVLSETSSGFIRHLQPEKAGGGNITAIRIAGKELSLTSTKLGGLTALPNNNFAIAGRGNDKVIIIDNNGKTLLTLGGGGDDEGELNDPVDVAYSQQGRIYIAEQGNHRISVFSPDGLFLFSMGQEGEKAGKKNLSQPFQVEIDAQDRVYVLEATQGGRLSIYAANGTLHRQIKGSDLKEQFGGNVSLSAMTVRPDGWVFLADKRSGQIGLLDWQQAKITERFGSSGQGRGQFKDVRSMVYHAKAGKLYIADLGNKKIEVFQVEKSTATETHADLFSVRKSSTLNTDCPVSYVFSDQQLLCLDADKKTVNLYSHEGKVDQPLKAKFSAPNRAVFDQTNILILDKKDVKVFDGKGSYLFTIGKKGSRVGEFHNPTGMALASEIYVADTGNQRVQVFSRNGVYLRSIGNTKGEAVRLQEPTSVAVDHHGRVYIADEKLAKVLIYSPQGKLMTQIGEDEKHPQRFKKIYDLMIDAQGMLYVLAQTTVNPRAIWMYKNQTLKFRFSPGQQKASFGLDASWVAKFIPKSDPNTLDDVVGTLQDSVTSIVKPAVDPKKQSFDFFNSANSGWIFNRIPSNNFAMAVVDLKTKARHTFMMMGIPQQVSGIKIGGDASTFTLHWKKPNSQFSGIYQISARTSKSEAFQTLAQTASTHWQQQRGDKPYTHYQITPISAYGKRGQPSRSYEDHFQTGYALYQQKDYQNSQQHFKRALSLNATHPGALGYLGHSLIADGSMDEAVGYFAALANIPGYETRAYNLHAEALIQNQAWLQAKKIIDTAIAGKFANDLSYGLCAQALLAVDDLLGSINCLEQAIQANPREIRWQLELAVAYASLDAMAQSKKAMTKAVQLAAKNADHWVDVSATYQSMGLLNDALVCLNTAIKLQPDHEEALFNLAQLHLQRKELDQARQIAMQMASNPALSGKANYILGRIALSQGKTGKALVMLNKASQQAGQLTIIWQSLADAYHANGNQEGVKRSLLSAIKIDPESFDLRLRLGGVCLNMESFDCSTTHYQKATYQQPNSYDAQIGLATSLLKQARFPQAAEHANKANSIDAKKSSGIMLIADIHIAQGNISEGIATLKRAIKLNNNNAVLHVKLGKAYFANQFYDLAQESAEYAITLAPNNPAPQALLGEIFLGRQMFDQAIDAFTKAGNIAPTEPLFRQRLNYVLLQKKSMAALGGAKVGLTLSGLKFEKVFAATYKQYANTPIGTISIQNNSGVAFQNVKLSLHVKQYMDFATTRTIATIQPHETLEIPLLASFNNNILSIDENTGVQTEIKASYYAMGKSQDIALTQPMTIYGKNAMLWSNMPMIGSFVTPKDEILSIFTRQGLNKHRHATGLLNKTLVKAMTVFELMSALDIKYIEDPNSPYSQLDAAQVDTVQFPRETLQVRSGDCDDLSVLLAAAWENLGIETALLDVPNHLLLMFNTGLPEQAAHTISNNKNLLAIRNGEVWIPIEATLIAASFSEAWVEGAAKYARYSASEKLTALTLKEAWGTYTPVTLPPASFNLPVPTGAGIETSMSQAWNRLAENAAGRAVLPFQQLLATDPDNKLAQMQIAIIYARYGLFAQATNMMQAIIAKHKNDSAAYNNLGNIHYLNNDMTTALASYQQAETLEPENADIKVNLAMAYYRQGIIPQSATKFSEAQKLDKGVNNRYKQLKVLLNK